MALVGFVLFPLAPPRMLPSSEGFVDTLVVYGPRYYGDADGRSLFNGYGSFPSLFNDYAAMPSMHVAWSASRGRSWPPRSRAGTSRWRPASSTRS